MGAPFECLLDRLEAEREIPQVEAKRGQGQATLHAAVVRPRR